MIKLPDGFEIDVTSFINIVPENLFNPKEVEDCIGLIDMIESAVKLEDESENIHFASIMYNNIVLSGGNTFLKGFEQKLSSELKPENMIIANENRDISAWMGGSIVTNLNSFNNMWVTKEE